jgi:hypothetical protein
MVKPTAVTFTIHTNCKKLGTCTCSQQNSFQVKFNLCGIEHKRSLHENSKIRIVK